MSYLINRTPPARLRCLHHLVQLAYSKFWENEFFMGDLLFNGDAENIHSYCTLLTKDPNLWIKFCPYLQNPLSNAGCYLTRWVEDDSTKKKEISNSVNSLDALWLLKRTWRKLRVTELWIKFASTKFESREWLEIAKLAICQYGQAVWLLYQISKSNTVFSTRELHVGYPNTNEHLLINDEIIEISSWSTNDTNTRTKSCLLAWFTTVWFIIPESLFSGDTAIDDPHLQTNKFITQRTIRNENRYYKWKIPEIFEGNFIVECPFDYNNLAKDSTALRENGQQVSREATMKNDWIIRNRRFAILYTLTLCFENKKLLNFQSLLKVMEENHKHFVINKETFPEALRNDLDIALMSWIPFEVLSEVLLKPLTWLNKGVLTLNAPSEVVELIDEIFLPRIYALSL